MKTMGKKGVSSFVLGYLYDKKLELISYEELIGEFNKSKSFYFKSMRKTIENLLNKRLIIESWKNNHIVYGISKKGIKCLLDQEKLMKLTSIKKNFGKVYQKVVNFVLEYLYYKELESVINIPYEELLGEFNSRKGYKIDSIKEIIKTLLN